ncbi:hypothetical protein MACH26_27160 [Planctobacterium marinum]|uniref:Uncharacterized protein n=1 Tax=Planctobacterium marinum TaxID=1631968 RepID=A0AA48HYZ0_9ALTE|nr:hypothetical protein MACH26_27160 [Planctobacterium marinum]
MFATVKRNWFDVLSDIISCLNHIIKRGFCITKPQLHDKTRRIIYKHEQATLGTSTFEPIMMRAIYLDQFT